jgi:hypothetical protein
MMGGGDAKENTLFTMDSCQWLTIPQRISAGRRAHVTRTEEGGDDSIEEAAAVVRTVQSRCVCSLLISEGKTEISTSGYAALDASLQ